MVGAVVASLSWFAATPAVAPPAEGTTRTQPVRAPTDEPVETEERPTDGAARIAELEAIIEELRFERELLRGQRAVSGAHPRAWPQELPSALRSDAPLAAAMEEALGDSDFTLEDVDCSEYPCLLRLRPTENTAPMAAATAASAQLGAIVKRLTGPDDDGVEVGIQVQTRGRGDEQVADVLGISLGMADAGPRDERVAARLDDLLHTTSGR